jgi:hypothetical protein
MRPMPALVRALRLHGLRLEIIALTVPAPRRVPAPHGEET